VAIPDYQTIMRPLLALLEDDEAHAIAELSHQLSDHFELSDDELNQRIKSGRQTVIRNRVGWTRTYLHEAGLLSLPVRGQCQISERGLQALLDCPEKLDNTYLMQFPEFVAFRYPNTIVEGGGETTSECDTESNATPDEALEQAYETLQQALASELLETIKQGSPAFFEQLVVDLMLAMGYGGSRKEADKATQYTADGGIDGVINEDPLGLDTIYLQAKRYTDATVGRPDCGCAGDETCPQRRIHYHQSF
jgi:restriction system protein